MTKKAILLGGFISLLFIFPAFAETTPTSTPEILIPTSTPEVIVPATPPTSTPEVVIPTSTPTTTPEIIISTSTPTSTHKIITPTSTPTTTPNIETPTSTPTTTPTLTTTNTTITETQIQTAIDKILNYLKSNQDEEGKIMDGTVTDWSIISFGADNQYADDINEKGVSLLEYEKKYNLDDPSDLNSCATYPRHILALLSAGVEKDDEAMLGLKNKIINDCYTDNKYGLNGINDDVFALISLLALDINPAENIVRDMVSNIKDWQLENGAFSWPDWMDPTQKTAGDDITGVSINALKYAQNKGVEIENEIINNAKDYLKNTQQTDGGWGYGSTDIMTTSWVLMGINALRETQNDWFNTTGQNPWYPLVNNLNEDGYYESAWVPGTADWFALKHAVPALAGKSWPIILDPIVENFSSGATFTYSGGGSTQAKTQTPSTTPTSTPDMDPATSTPTTTLDLEIPTTTPSTTLEILITTTTPTTTLTIDTNPKPIIPKTNVVKKITTSNVKNNIIKKTQTPTNTLILSTGDEPNKKIDTEKILNHLPIDSPTRRNAKKALAVSGGGTVLLGLYLGLKLFKNLL